MRSAGDMTSSICTSWYPAPPDSNEQDLCAIANRVLSGNDTAWPSLFRKATALTSRKNPASPPGSPLAGAAKPRERTARSPAPRMLRVFSN